jgi:hypothetical protein
MAQALAVLRTALDAACAGHETAKRSLIAGWLAGVPLWLEGPPGCGKTALACALGRASGERLALWTADALEDARNAVTVLERRRDGRTERLRAVASEPRWRDADILVVEGARAETLPTLGSAVRGGPLLICLATLSAQQDADRASAPATACPLRGRMLRVRMTGLIHGEASALAAALNAVATRSTDTRPRALAHGTAARLRAHASALPLDAALRDALAAIVARLSAASPAWTGAHTAWLAAGPRLVRALAALRGDTRVTSADLEALEALWSEPAAHDATPRDTRAVQAGALQLAGARGARSETGAVGQGVPRHPAQAPICVRDVALAPEPPSREASRSQHTTTSDSPALARLVERLAGTFGRGGRPAPDPAGAPRSRRPLRRLDELPDADPVELASYVDGTLAGLPAVLGRARRRSGGRVVLLRDVSASMQGPAGRWSSRLVASLVDAVAARALPLGYVEFHHEAERFLAGGRPLHRDYAAVRARASTARAEGQTSYEAPLRAALASLAIAPRSAARDQIVLVTDGVPVVGDPWVAREIATARRIRAVVHTVYVGLGVPPAVLRALSARTGGTCAHVIVRPGGEPAIALLSARDHR